MGIRDIEPVGQYAVRLVFDDGHDTGLYTWKYLRELGERRVAELVRVISSASSAPRPGRPDEWRRKRKGRVVTPGRIFTRPPLVDSFRDVNRGAILWHVEAKRHWNCHLQLTEIPN